MNFIVRITIWGVWYDSQPMSLDLAEKAYEEVKETNPNLNVQLIEKEE